MMYTPLLKIAKPRLPRVIVLRPFADDRKQREIGATFYPWRSGLFEVKRTFNLWTEQGLGVYVSRALDAELTAAGYTVKTDKDASETDDTIVIEGTVIEGYCRVLMGGRVSLKVKVCMKSQQRVFFQKEFAAGTTKGNDFQVDLPTKEEQVSLMLSLYNKVCQEVTGKILQDMARVL